MEIRSLTPDYAVSPQITPDDVTAIRAAGFTTLIDNRPDAEIPAEVGTEAMRRAAEAAGLVFDLQAAGTEAGGRERAGAVRGDRRREGACLRLLRLGQPLLDRLGDEPGRRASDRRADRHSGGLGLQP